MGFGVKVCAWGSECKVLGGLGSGCKVLGFRVRYTLSPKPLGFGLLLWGLMFTRVGAVSGSGVLGNHQYLFNRPVW